VIETSAEQNVMKSRVELFEQIRRDRRIEGLPIGEPAERQCSSAHGARRTACQALASPPRRKQYSPRLRLATEPYAQICGWLAVA
jgi:hypothetical protein